MGNILGTVKSQATDTLKNIATGKNAAYIGIGVGSVVFIFLVIALRLKQPVMKPLFTNLDPRDASEIVERLESDSIPYKMDQSGRTISVAEQEVARLRLSLAGEGLPSKGIVGYEIFDKTGLTATDFDRRMNYVRGLQGELTRTISSIEGVEQARVHITLPEETLFISQTKPSTAAVLLKMKPGAEVDKHMVKAIANLVSKSVEGLGPENVTIVDTKARLLSEDYDLNGLGGSTFPGSTSLLDIQKEFQREMENRIQTLLEHVLGPGNVAVRVNASLNFDRTTVTEDLFAPANNGENAGLNRSMSMLREIMAGKGTLPGWVLGLDAQRGIPEYGVPDQILEDERPLYVKDQVTTNYEINQIRRETIVAPGSVKSLSVAVVVNRPDLTETQKQAIQSTVSASLGVGLDPQRNDLVTVTGMAFDTTLADQIKAGFEAEISTDKGKRRYIEFSVAVLASLVIVALILTMGRKRRHAGKVSLALSEVAVTQGPSEATIEEVKERRVKQHIEDLAKTNPEGVAQLLKAWLAEEQR